MAKEEEKLIKSIHGFEEIGVRSLHSPKEGLTEDEIKERMAECKKPFRDFGSALGWGEIGE